MLKSILLKPNFKCIRFLSITGNGKDLYYPKYGNSFYEPGIKIPDEKEKNKIKNLNKTKKGTTSKKLKKGKPLTQEEKNHLVDR
jgi:hypothetical protein